MHEDPLSPIQQPAGTLEVVRDARVFTAGADRIRELESLGRVHRLLAGQELELDPPCDLVVRQGNLRVSEYLPDGREVTRAVLQTGMVCRLRDGEPAVDSDAADSPLYSLAATALISLGASEIWQLPTDALATR
jgi:hypothetical protein